MAGFSAGAGVVAFVGGLERDVVICGGREAWGSLGVEALGGLVAVRR